MSKIKARPAELALQSNGRKITSNRKKWQEIGTPGLDIWSGFVNEAYHTDLYWPSVYPLFNRIRRSDPEISISRQMFVSFARQLSLSWVPATDEPNESDTKAVDFGNEALLDLDGGVADLLETIVSYVPFMGWGWWEVVPGLRRQGWRPPGSEDPWRSKYDDGLVGIRRLAWRDHSSFSSWDIDETNGRLFGMNQRDEPNQEITIPLDQSVHLKFGDTVNPEGLSPLEAVWRLERIKYGLEVVQGIGFEHAAGHAKFQAEKELTADDKVQIKKAARSLLTAQEGNYLMLPGHVQADVEDIDFSAARSILEAIKYYGVLKLQVFFMQWAALSASTGTGSFAAKKEDVEMFVLFYNSMMQGFAAQIGEQLAPHLFRMNAAQWPQLTAPPRLTVSKLDKSINLEELAGWIKAMKDTGFDLDDQDALWIRKRAGMPEELPEIDDEVEIPDVGNDEDDEPEIDLEVIDEGEIREAMGRFQQWARKRAPRIAQLLDRRTR